MEVVPSDTGIEYSNPDDVPPRTPISGVVECAGWGGDLRVCSFERHLLDEGFISTEIYTTNPDYDGRFPIYSANYYEYVQLDGIVYEPRYVANDSTLTTQRSLNWLSSVKR